MKSIIPLTALVTSLCTLSATVRADIDQSTVKEGRAIIKGNIDGSHDLVVRINRGEKPLEWRIGGHGGEFQATIEASHTIPLDNGTMGHGFVVTTQQGTKKTVTNIALTGGNPVVGTFTTRREGDFVKKDSVITFADITLPSGKKSSVSFSLEPKKE